MRRCRSALVSGTALLILCLSGAALGQAPPDSARLPDATPPADQVAPDSRPAQDAAPPDTPAADPGRSLLTLFPLQQGAMGGFGGGPGGMPGLGGPSLLRADLRTTWFPSQSVSFSSSRLGYQQTDLSLSVPIPLDDHNFLGASVSMRNELFNNTSARLPDTGQPFPDDLASIRFGLNYTHRFDNGWAAGGMVSVGSASDKPFHSVEEVQAGVTTFLRIPQGEHNAWLLSLSYSPTSEVGIPIPGVAYSYQPSDTFRANIGLPFQILYRPLEDLSLDFSYMLIRNVHAGVVYRIAPQLFAHAAYDWSNESYFLADRPDYQDRFFYYDQRVTVGVQYVFTPRAALDLAGGYVFDRFYFEGKQYSDRDHNRLDVGEGPFVSLQFRVRY